MVAVHQPIWALPIEEVYESLSTQATGLPSAEAQSRLAQFGPNELPAPAHRPLALRFFDQLTHFMALLLWVAGILAFVSRTPALGWAIWAVVLINALFSFGQEFQAERALAALKKVLPLQVKVLRDGVLQLIPARDLVRGDVMHLEEGDRISADARLVSAESFAVDVSVLTGESLPVARNAHPVGIREAVALRAGKPLPRAGEHPLQERVNPAEIANLVLAGSTVAAGRAVAVVYATGAQTEFGQVAHLTTSVQRDPSTLETQVARIVQIITAIAIGMGLTVFGLAYGLVGLDLSESFIFAIGIIVANVPEGLLPTVTLALALGVQRMAKQNALVRRLSAVETLSATSVICTDKTGTLTQNEMTVRHLWLPSLLNGDPHSPRLIDVTGSGYDPTTGTVQVPADPDLARAVRLLLTGAALCSNARLIHPSSEGWREIGDPTEAALLVAAVKAGIRLDELPEQLPRLREVPFDSRRRMMTVVLDWRQGDNFFQVFQALSHLAITKGAPLEVVRHCQGILKNGTAHPLTQKEVETVIAANDHLARQGFRVLGVAIRPGDEGFLSLRSQELEQDLIFVGLIAMFDPPRPEVASALAHCHRAGIKVTMVTGDYGLTAEAIARQIGLVNPAPHDRVRVVTGEGMSHLTDAQLRQLLTYRSALVFARMSPEHKLRLVQAYKAMGEVVAVTGDGVNDAPALRAAHIGIAMGKNGTDVAREAADVVLTDDNFATIVSAIEQGRAIYQNIRKFMTYILASNIPEIVPFLAMVMFKIPPALTILQILAVDLGTDMVPALALGAEPPEPGTLTRPPRRKTEFLLDPSLLWRAYGFLGWVEALLSMLGFLGVWWSHGYSFGDLQRITPQILAHTADPALVEIYRQATTVALAAIVTAQMGNLFACRSEWVSAFRLNGRNNPLLWVGLGTECVALLAFIYLPVFQEVFSTFPPTEAQWLLLLFCPALL
ncbi:MAG: cation-transporting P-type ATPase, partial [Cyanobacteriota bacterium]